MDWKFASRLAVSVVVAVLMVALAFGVHFFAELWLALAIALERFVGPGFSGAIALLPVWAVAYVLLYGIKDPRV